jgi:hypothetical protein
MSRFGGKSSNSEWMIDGKWNSCVFNWLVARTAYGLTDRSHETGLLAATIHLSAGAAAATAVGYEHCYARKWRQSKPLLRRHAARSQRIKLD